MCAAAAARPAPPSRDCGSQDQGIYLLAVDSVVRAQRIIY